MNTANIDNPRLNVRLWEGKDPVRIVIDPNNKLIDNNNILNDNSISLIYNKTLNKMSRNKYFVKINPFTIDKIYKDLYKRGINSLLVEGGRFTLNKIIEKGLWDEARVFESQIKFNRGIKGPNIEKTSFEKVGEDKLFKINNNA